MTDRELTMRFKEVYDAIFETSQQISKFNDILHIQENDLIKQNEDALIETDTATNDRITTIEDALIELDEQINGGTDNG